MRTARLAPFILGLAALVPGGVGAAGEAAFETQLVTGFNRLNDQLTSPERARQSGFPREIPAERMDEMARRLAPLGWTPTTERLGEWTLYALRHADGTVWRSVFGNQLYRQEYRLLHPEWIELDRSYTDALLLELHSRLAAKGWSAEFVLSPHAGPDLPPDVSIAPKFPERSFALRHKDGRVRSTPYESEFRYWLLNGPESCWGADRPFPNCPAQPVTVSAEQIVEQ